MRGAKPVLPRGGNPPGEADGDAVQATSWRCRVEATSGAGSALVTKDRARRRSGEVNTPSMASKAGAGSQNHCMTSTSRWSSRYVAASLPPASRGQRARYLGITRTTRSDRGELKASLRVPAGPVASARGAAGARSKRRGYRPRPPLERVVSLGFPVVSIEEGRIAVVRDPRGDLRLDSCSFRIRPPTGPLRDLGRDTSPQFDIRDQLTTGEILRQALRLKFNAVRRATRRSRSS